MDAILRKTSEAPVQERLGQQLWPPAGTLDDYWVSESSRFTDEVWEFIDPTPGARGGRTRINWKMLMCDGSVLTRPEHAVRLHWARVLMSSRLIAPADGRPPVPATLGPMRTALKWLISWMVEQGYHSPEELTPQVTESYFDDLPRFIISQQDDEEISANTVTMALHGLNLLWLQRGALLKAGVASLPSDPFFGKGAIAAVAENIATKPSGGWIKPLPDQVAIPLFNKAYSFLYTPAQDVIRLLNLLHPAGHLVIPPQKERDQK